MWRAIVVVVVLACVACDDAMDSAPDAQLLPSRGSLSVPVGAACDVQQSMWCADYYGLCTEAVCRRQCSTSAPLCATGEHVVSGNGRGGAPCVCVPD